MDFYSKELIDYIMVLCERMGPKTYKHDEVRNLDNKVLSKMDLFYMKKNKKMKSKTLMYMNT